MTDIPDTLIENHDIVVDYIVTPTKVIECEHRKKPAGIIWSKITRDKLQQVTAEFYILYICACAPPLPNPHKKKTYVLKR